MIVLLRVCTIGGKAAMHGSILRSQQYPGEAKVEQFYAFSDKCPIRSNSLDSISLAIFSNFESRSSFS